MSIYDGFNGLSAEDLVKMTSQSDKGVDIRLVEVSNCCEDDLLDELPEEDEDEGVD